MSVVMINNKQRFDSEMYDLQRRIDAAQDKLAVLLRAQRRKDRNEAIFKVCVYLGCALCAGFGWYLIVKGAAYLLTLAGVKLVGI